MAEANDGQREGDDEPQNTFTIPPCEILPQAFPDGPDLFDEVEWGPHPTDEDVQKAYTIWSAQDSVIALEENELANPPPVDYTSKQHRATYCLVENVYQNLMQNCLLPITPSEWDAQAQYREPTDESRQRGWTYEELLGKDPPEAAVPVRSHTEPLRINGRLKTDKKWTKPIVTQELRERGLDTTGNVQALRDRLFAHEVERIRRPSSPQLIDKDKTGQFRREDLTQWGIPRQGVYAPQIIVNRDLSPLDVYTWAILLSPYNPAYWTSRAFLYYQMGFFDLAIGDAYRAQLLCEILVNPLRRNTQPGLYIRIWDAIERHVLQIPRSKSELPRAVEFLRWANGVNHFIPAVRKALHHIIALSLLALQCWRDYQAIEPVLRTRIVMPDRDASAIKTREDGLREFIDKTLQDKEADKEEFYYERRYGAMPGRPYPYGPQKEPRNNDAFLEKINIDVLGRSPASNLYSKKIKAQWDGDSGELGVWATEFIPKGEIVYVDEPSIRGHLQPKEKLETMDYYCENCKRPLDPVDRETPLVLEENVDVCPCSTLHADALFWCRQPPAEGTPEDELNNAPTAKRKRGKKRSQDSDDQDEQSSNKKQKTASCLDIARSLYHHRACGKDWKWLHNAMRPIVVDDDDRTGRPPRVTHTNEDHGTALSLLLREVFDITLHRREVEGKPNLLAHEIDELMPLMGAGDMSEHNIPFSMAANIKVPFEILSLLGVNIFRDLTFDTWVIQIVLRKLLLNAIPWDKSRRLIDRVESAETKNLKKGSLVHLQEDEFHKVDPAFKDLYIFPGAAMFNHSCRPYDNAMCDWDSAIPNRLVIWATKDIEPDEELFIRYSNFTFDTRRAFRILGDPCYCQACENRSVSPDQERGSSYYGPSTSPDSPGPEPLHKQAAREMGLEGGTDDQAEDAGQGSDADTDVAPGEAAPTGTTVRLAESGEEEQATASQPPTSRAQGTGGPRIRYRGQTVTREQYKDIIDQEREEKRVRQETQEGSDSASEQSSSSGPEYPVGGSARYLSKHGSG